MKISLIAHTQITNRQALIQAGYEPWPRFQEEDADELAEFAGRLCYESWDRPNPATATNAGYVRNIMEHKHFSVLEHSSATFLFQGVSRALTHELVRHRHFSFSQVSQRYVDHSDRPVVFHPSLEGRESLIVADAAEYARDAYRRLVQSLRARGVDKKTAHGAARSVLPEATDTSILVTGNHRSWLEFLDKRNSKFADPEIRELAKALVPLLKSIAPNIYQDISEGNDEPNPVGEYIEATEETINPVGCDHGKMIQTKPAGWYMQ